MNNTDAKNAYAHLTASIWEKTTGKDGKKFQTWKHWGSLWLLLFLLPFFSNFAMKEKQLRNFELMHLAKTKITTES